MINPFVSKSKLTEHLQLYSFFIKTDTKLRKSAQIQHLSEKQRKKKRKIAPIKEPDITTYTKKYRVLEEGH